MDVRSAYRNISRRRFIAGLAGLTSTLMMASTLGPTRPAHAATRPLFGAWVPGAPFDGSSTSTASIDALERVLGARLDVLHWFRGWAHAGGPEPGLLRLVAERGSVPLITWEPWDYTQPASTQSSFALRNISGGAFDGHIDNWARELAGYGGPVTIRFAHEMNGSSYPWSIGILGNTAEDYVTAWRHVVGRFRMAGASNVRFLWCPNVDWAGSGRPPLADLFPGDEWVDLVGLDGYNGGSALDWGGWQSFAQIFDASLREVLRISSRDAWIGETASAEAGDGKAQWITEMWAYLAGIPRVCALVWFNEVRETDWRLESSPAALDAMRAALAGATPPAPTPGSSTAPPASAPMPTPTTTSTPGSSTTPMPTATPPVTSTGNYLERILRRRRQLMG